MHYEHCLTDYEDFEYIFASVLKKYAAKKKGVIRGNHRLHLNKEVRKAIMLKFRLKNKANKTEGDVHIPAYKKSCNYVVAIDQKLEHNYFNNLNVSKEPKPFRKTYKVYFPNKHNRWDTGIILIAK